MDILSNKKERKTQKRDTSGREPIIRKTIGLEAQLAEAKRLFRLLENPELLKQQLP